jgi:4-amino-4-deoxy-L-arabinose transferase-like glycosyltransferase
LPGLAQKLTEKYWIVAILIALVGLAFKLALIASNAFPFNSDEAIVGLMARHILNGEWPVFFYGQAYMGSLDASLAAVGFALLGEAVWVIRLLQALLYVATILTTAVLGWSIYRNAWVAWVAAALLAVPSVNVTLYTTVSLGGYGEALLIGNLLMLLALQVRRKGKGFALWGFLAGLGFWAFGLTLIFTIPAGFLVARKAWHTKSKLVVAFASFLLGALPWIFEAVRQGFSPFLTELLGGAISGASSGGISSVLQHFVNLLLFGPTVVFGLRPPWSAELIALPLAAVALIFWLLVIVYGVTRLKVHDEARAGRWLLFGVMVTLLAGFLLTPFGADPSGRYFLPLAVPMALMAGELFTALLMPRVGRWAFAALGLVLIFNLWGIVQTAGQNPPGITTQFDPIAQVDHSYLPELIEFLDAEGESTGYTNYWVAYPLAFLSDERLIFTPRLPYHQDFRYTDRDDRYAPFGEVVTQSPTRAFITTNFAELNQILGESLDQHKIEFEVTEIGPYTVFHGLSEVIDPNQLGVYLGP